MDEIIKGLRSLPLKEFEKCFNEMYDAANEVQKDEIIRSFKKSTDEHILKVDSFIKETKMKMKYEDMLEAEFV